MKDMRNRAPPDPALLCLPNIPKPLHGVAPRVIMGRIRWDEMRHAAYAEAGFRCQACGVEKHMAQYHPWLEAHEVYGYDYERGRLVFLRLAALCHACHNFIHDGRMQMMVEAGEMTEAMYKAILGHGKGILAKAGLLARWRRRHSHRCIIPWNGWRLVFEGKEYGPSTQSMGEWVEGQWRNWKP